MILDATEDTISSELDQSSPYPFVMSEHEKALFDQSIKDSQHYLEFGMGGSSIRAIQESQAMIYTVESSLDWISQMRQYDLVRDFENKRLHIFPVDIGPVIGWGFPESEVFKESFEKYSSSIFESIDSKLIDLVLIDGRFRVACTLKTILACHNNRHIKILIHDFWNRPHYHVVLKYLDTLAQVDTLGLFSIKQNVDLKAVKHDYEEFKFIPE